MDPKAERQHFDFGELVLRPRTAPRTAFLYSPVCFWSKEGLYVGTSERSGGKPQQASYLFRFWVFVFDFRFGFGFSFLIFVLVFVFDFRFWFLVLDFDFRF